MYIMIILKTEKYLIELLYDVSKKILHSYRCTHIKINLKTEEELYSKYDKVHDDIMCD